MACEEDILEWSRSLIICASSAKEGTVLTQCFGYDIMLMSWLKDDDDDDDDEGVLFSLSGVVEGFEDSSIVAEFGCISLMMNCFCACGRTRWCVLFVCRGDPSEAADDSDPHDDDMCSLFDRVCCSLFDRVCCSLFDRVCCSLFDRVCSLFDRVCSLFDRVCHSVEDSKSAAGSRRDAPHEVPHWLFFFVVFFFSECYFFVICYFFVFLFELLPFASVCLYRACLRVDDSKSGRRTLLKGGEL